MRASGPLVARDPMMVTAQLVWAKGYALDS
jgi:hypothetical protein